MTPVSQNIKPFTSQPESQLLKICETLTGHKATSAAFATEAPFLSQMEMDTIVLGPGNIAQAHQPDEYLALNTLEPTVSLLRNLINRYCLQPDDGRK